MKTTGIDKLDTTTLVGYLATYGRIQALSMDIGDSQVSNLAAKKIIQIYQLLHERGEQTQPAVLRLLDDDDPNVRMTGAYMVLEFAPDKAERVLEDISASEQRLTGFRAEMLLENWRKGTLQFPWSEKRTVN